MTTSHILTLDCPDQPGIVAAVTAGIAGSGGNILSNVQFSEPSVERFCMRTRFTLAATGDHHDLVEELEATVRSAVNVGDGGLQIRPAEHRTRTIIMVSRFDHCLRDLLYRWHAGELPLDVAAVVSNHWDLQPVAAQYGVPFVHVPVTRETKPQAEGRLLELVDEHGAELVVLARYMQILSDDLCRKLDGRAINIHHSFLPGFKGAKPYHQAWERGVKLIGATAHFVTADLDEGPIIDQDVARVSHLQTPEDLVIIGRDVERIVLSRAVKAFAEQRVFRFAERTVVF
ncbi:formyltetrahydrofolate deformylase [Euzebya tangerina]|uniref:formyltetrahydrofolate deformylase n=1 Tax=Euzebya tangerina TaxID=591198 RepID=UPI000E3114DB|nr:formyltetrahydrofolate deformylase [Euzebya tangerina]